MDHVWEEVIGDGPLVAPAVHDGHEVRGEVIRLLALDDDVRLREEDPFTGQWTTVTEIGSALAWTVAGILEELKLV